MYPGENVIDAHIMRNGTLVWGGEYRAQSRQSAELFLHFFYLLLPKQLIKENNHDNVNSWSEPEFLNFWGAQESIPRIQFPPANVAWREGTPTLFLLGS